MEQLVTDEHEAALRSRIIAAVQAELDRYASTVMAESEKLRADTLRERDDLHTSFAGDIKELARNVASMAEVQKQLGTQLNELKISEVEARLNRRIEQITSSLDSLVAGAARPLLQSVHDDQEAVAARIEVLAGDLRKFDEQAARLVVYFNEMTEKMQERADQASQRVNGEMNDQIARLGGRVDEVEASSLRQHVETSKMVNDRAERLEERVNVKVSTVDGSIREEVGSRIAEIDAHVGRVSQGLDDTLNVLGDRISAIEQAVGGMDDRLDALREEFAAVDTDSLDELKEKLSAAAGEAMLVRIDLERLEKSTTERVESANARLATVESQLADATMDVSTAVQLERLEELERAVMELEPARATVRTDHDDSTDHDDTTTNNNDDRGTDSGAA